MERALVGSDKRTGLHTAAIGAYRHYLALRSDPELALHARADSVRAALRALEGSAVAKRLDQGF